MKLHTIVTDLASDATSAAEALRLACCLLLAVATASTTAIASPIGQAENNVDITDLRLVKQLDRDMASLASQSRTNTRRRGETYGLAATGFNTDGSTGWYVSDEGGVSLEFSGETVHEIAPSYFGNTGDRMFVIESTRELGDGRMRVLIDVVAVDSDFNLTNWYADGSEVAPGVPFEAAAVNIGDFNAPHDKLDLLGGMEEYYLESAEYYFVGTGNGYFGPSGEPFQWFDTTSDDGISGSSYTYFGSDISTTTFGGQEFAGFSMSFVLSPASVPEPASAMMLAPLAALAGVRRR